MLWLDEVTYMDLPRARRVALVRAQIAHRRGAVPSVRRWSGLLDKVVLRAQADGHRVWWPSLVATNADVLSRVVSPVPTGAAPGSLPSRHTEVPGSTWERCAAVLPDARTLAESFPGWGGPNCFSNGRRG